MPKPAAQTDYLTLTDAHKKLWAKGNFYEIVHHNVVMAERLCSAVELRAGERVLDIACGTGTAALVAARHYCEVTGVDFVAELIERAKLRAQAEGYDICWQVSDAQNLLFEDDSFDVVLSVYGMQFAPNQQCVATELLRVCKPGGRIGLASPMPEGWTGDLLATRTRCRPAALLG
jgi:ubiquinone/menaquinone biosynthesis C-methylase UbiE